MTINGTNGNDTLNGGLGNDTVSYADATAGVLVNLFDGTATGGAGTDTLLSIENVIGSEFDDFINGPFEGNVLDGCGGNDGFFTLMPFFRQYAKLLR